MYIKKKDWSTKQCALIKTTHWSSGWCVLITNQTSSNESRGRNGLGSIRVTAGKPMYQNVDFTDQYHKCVLTEHHQKCVLTEHHHKCALTEHHHKCVSHSLWLQFNWSFHKFSFSLLISSGSAILAASSFSHRSMPLSFLPFSSYLLIQKKKIFSLSKNPHETYLQLSVRTGTQSCQ